MVRTGTLGVVGTVSCATEGLDRTDFLPTDGVTSRGSCMMSRLHTHVTYLTLMTSFSAARVLVGRLRTLSLVRLRSCVGGDVFNMAKSINHGRDVGGCHACGEHARGKRLI